MPKARRAPDASIPGKSDRVSVACLAVLLALATGWLIYGDSSPEYVWHQRAFRDAVRQRSGEAAAATVPTGIQQIWIPQAGDANRCVTCHQATTWRGFEASAEPLRTHPADILRSHPPDRFGCTPCHGGQGWAVDKARAHGHVAHWHEPLLDTALADALMSGAGRRTLMELRCNACHRYERETSGAHVNRAKRLVDQKGAGHATGSTARRPTGPGPRRDGDKNRSSRLQSPAGRPSAAWHSAHFQTFARWSRTLSCRTSTSRPTKSRRSP
jgi:hypothetical protein